LGYFVEKSVKTAKALVVGLQRLGFAPDPELLFSYVTALRNLKAFVGGILKHFAPRRKGTLAPPLVI